MHVRHYYKYFAMLTQLLKVYTINILILKLKKLRRKESPPISNKGRKIPNKRFPGDSDGKASARNVGDLGSIPGLGRSPGEGNGNPLQYSCLENPMDGEDW